MSVRPCVAIVAAIAIAALQRRRRHLPSILISRQLSESEHLAVGDVVRLSASADGSRVQQFRIAGIYEPTPDPARLGAVIREVQLHLPDLLEPDARARDAGGSEYVADDQRRARRSGRRRAPFRATSRRGCPASTHSRRTGAAESTGPFIVLRRFHLAIAIVTIVASTVFLLALTIMLVDERRATVGVLRLIGLPIRRILVQLFIEGVLIATVGSLFGLVALAACRKGSSTASSSGGTTPRWSSCA